MDRRSPAAVNDRKEWAEMQMLAMERERRRRRRNFRRTIRIGELTLLALRAQVAV
jgi:hypothetical protein